MQLKLMLIQQSYQYTDNYTSQYYYDKIQPSISLLVVEQED